MNEIFTSSGSLFVTAAYYHRVDKTGITNLPFYFSRVIKAIFQSNFLTMRRYSDST